ncbi:UMP kinase [Spirochaetota bacterium]
MKSKINSSQPYKRVLLKLSGQALAGEGNNIDPLVLKKIAGEIKEIHKLGVQLVIVVGGGNIVRGSELEKLGIKRTIGDSMGMLATIMNALAFKDVLEDMGVSSRVMTSVEMKEFAEPYIIDKAESHLNNNHVVFAAGGTGHPYFTTDTAASLRSIELKADVLLKATRVDGVYSGDPEKDKNAVKFDSITYADVLEKQLRVMDLTAISLCMDNKVPIIVFDLFKKESLKNIILGQNIGTRISF